jgi:hypothetical protein
LVPAKEDGYTYPPERRGDRVASLTVQVLEGAPDGTGPTRVYYTIKVEGPADLEVEAPELIDSAGAWAVRRSSAWALAEGRVTWTDFVILDQVKPGLVELPDVNLRFGNGSTGTRDEVEWKDILKDLQELPGPKLPPARAQQFGLAGWLLAASGAATALILIAAAFMRRRKASPLSAAQRALLELERLERSATASDDESERLFTQLSDIVRHYIANRFGLPALQQTTSEFLSLTSDVPILVAETDFLRNFLDQCDLAKFAGVHANRERWNHAAKELRAFITRTSTDTRAPVIPAAQTVSNGHP